MALITGFGGANADLHIRLDGPLRAGDSNLSRFKRSAGGVVRNILENLAKLGNETALLSAVGDDADGDRLLARCAKEGIDVSRVVRDPAQPTAAYVVFLDPAGEMIVAANDMSVIESIGPAVPDGAADLIRSSDALVCDANPSPEAIERFAALADGIPLYADPVSAAKAARLLPILPRLTLIKPNVMELARLTDLPCNSPEAIARAADSLLKKGTGAVCVSLGRDGCYYADRNGERFTLSIAPVDVMGNATGAGDAFLAAMIHAQRKGLAPRDAVRFALGAGRLAVRSAETIHPQMSERLIEMELNE